jgi:hypothetical protein
MLFLFAGNFPSLTIMIQETDVSQASARPDCGRVASCRLVPIATKYLPNCLSRCTLASISTPTAWATEICPEQWCMLIAVDPLLHRLEALPEQGCYSVSFLLETGQERCVVMKVSDGDVLAPEANMVPGWSSASESFRAVLAAVRAFDTAREQLSGGALLRDVPGGWDVSVGNVILAEGGHPACVAHGELELAQPATYACPTCGAQALFGEPRAG